MKSKAKSGQKFFMLLFFLDRGDRGVVAVK
jgi:hypothetical protein